MEYGKYAHLYPNFRPTVSVETFYDFQNHFSLVAFEGSYPLPDRRMQAWLTFKYEVSRTMEERPDGYVFTQVGGDFFADIRHSCLTNFDLAKEMVGISERLPKEIEV